MIALSLLLLEGLLRMSVSFSERRRYRHRPNSSRIWCVGDSHTEGVGAGKDESYPDHLQRSFGEPVLNLGVSGSNSSQALGRIERQLEMWGPPAVVVFLAGMNDGRNVREVDPALFGNSTAPHFRRVLQEVRLYQVARAILIRFRLVLKSDVLQMTPKEWESLKKYANSENLTSDQFLFLTIIDIDTGDWKKALEHFESFMSRRASDGGRFGTFLREDLIYQELKRLVLMQNGLAEEGLFERPPPPDSLLEDRVLFHMGRGWWNLWRGRTAQATDDFRLLVTLPLYPMQRIEVYQGLGWCAIWSGRPKQAQDYFSMAFKTGDVPLIPPRLFWSYAGNVVAALELGDGKRARFELGRMPEPLRDAIAENCALEVLAVRAGGPGRTRSGRRFSAGCEAYLGAIRARPAGEVQFRRLLPITSYLELRSQVFPKPLVDDGFGRRVLSANVGRLAFMATKRGFSAILATYPQLTSHQINEDIRGVAREKGLPLVDLEGLIEDGLGRRSIRYVSPDGGHPNGEGYRRMSEMMRPELSRALARVHPPSK